MNLSPYREIPQIVKNIPTSYAVFTEPAAGFLSNMNTVRNLSLTVRDYLERVGDASGKDENN
jgi:hypothetical protein